MSKEKDLKDSYEKEEKNNFTSKNRMPAVIGAITIVVLLLAGVVMFGRKISEIKVEEQTYGVDSESMSAAGGVVEDDAIQMETDVRRIFLMPHENMSVKEFNSALEILKGRLDVLCDGKVYEMEVSADMVELTLPTSLFKELDFDQLMQRYLSRKMEYFGYHLGTEKSSEPEYITIRRDDFASVSLNHGMVDGFDESLLGEEVTEYPYIKLVFTDEFLETYGDEIVSWGEDFVLAQDVENSTWWYYHLYPEGDGKTFCLVNAEEGRNLTELLYYNLTHNSLAETFYYSTDINYDTVWEYPSLIDTPGKYQKNANDITGRTLTLQCPTQKAPTEVEWLVLKTLLKKRMDALGESYAFGVLETEEGGRVAVIKTASAHMGFPVMELLEAKKSDIAILGGLEKRYVESLHYETNDDGTYSMYATVTQYAVDGLERVMNGLEEDGISTIYLTVGDIEWMSTDIGNYEGNGVLVFDRFCFRNGEPLTAEDEWMLCILEEICNGDDIPLNFTDQTYQLNKDENGAMASVDDFMISYSTFSEPIKKKIIELCEGVTVTTNNKTIYVSLHQNTDKDFAKTSMEQVKEIYENCGFLESGFETIIFYILDENEQIRERGRVFFTKSYSISDHIPGYVYVAGVFANGRLEEYKEEFKEIVETDPFFVELISPHGANWQFEF